jgi:hypothetical protein
MRRAGRRHYKSPNLGEAYEHFTGRPLEGAHNAMVDVKACMAVYFAIKDWQNPAAAAKAPPVDNAHVAPGCEQFHSKPATPDAPAASTPTIGGLGIIR